MTNVGGDPSAMTGGASTLHTAGTALRQLESAIDESLRAVAGNAGQESLSGAARRLGAAYGTLIGETGTQTLLAAQLAANAAADLSAATGGPQ